VTGAVAEVALSIAHGIPIAEEPGVGALTIGGYLREVSERYASREALVMHATNGVTRWSYADLWDRSCEVARALVAHGTARDERVGIMMSNRPEYLSAAFGTSLAGGVAVMLSTFSTPPELEYLLSASQVSVLMVERRVLKQDFLAMLAGLDPAIALAGEGAVSSEKFPYLRKVIALDAITPGEDSGPCYAEHWDSFLASAEIVPQAIVDARAAGVHPTEVATLFFSSGTTSLPKGILHAHRAVALQWWRWPLRMGCLEQARVWTGNGFFWSGNFSMQIGNAFSTGGALVIQPTFEPESALEVMAQEKVNFPVGRPHQWSRLQAAKNWDKVDLSSVTFIDVDSILAQHPTVKTDWHMPLAYGTTETLTVNTAFSFHAPPEDRLTSYGRPLGGNTLKVVDPMTGKVLPLGEKGELGVKGPTLMLHYLGKSPEECFDSEGFYMTGDGAWLDETGRMFWEGRINDLIKTGGANVSPLEVDNVIARFPGVKRTQTVGIPDDLMGEIVVACIVPLEGETLSESEIIAFVKQELASFKVPRRVLFFAEEDYALTGNEKIKTATLRELAIKRLEAEKA
jgi:fatty-acyl-CoA synthase